MRRRRRRNSDGHSSPRIQLAIWSVSVRSRAHASGLELVLPEPTAPVVGDGSQLESLILAQNERWRHA